MKKIWFFNNRNIRRSEKMGTSLILLEAPATWLVCLLGVGIVFAGLVCIIGLVELMTFICNKITSRSASKVANSAPAQAPVQASAPKQGAEIENRGELIAAICAAVAEENGTDISAIRVISFKKL